MPLTGKDALARVGELLKLLSTPKSKNTAKKQTPAETLKEDACLLIPFVERLGLKFGPNVKAEPQRIFTTLNHSKGQSVSVDEWNEVLRRFEVYFAAVNVPDHHCLAIARFLQSDFLKSASEIDGASKTGSNAVASTLHLYFDAHVVHDQLTALGLHFGFTTKSPAFEKLLDLSDENNSRLSGLSIGIGDNCHPLDQGQPTVFCPEVSTVSGESLLMLQYYSEQEIADRWLQESCRAVLDAAQQHSELPEGWEFGDLRQCHWPLSPLHSQSELSAWLKSSRTRFFQHRDKPEKATDCLQEGQRVFRNARRALSMLMLPVPKRLANKPQDLDEAERLFDLLIRRFDPTDPPPPNHKGRSAAERAKQLKGRKTHTDSTLVCAKDLAPFAKIGERCIRDALRDAGCEPSVLSTGKANPHKWKYCDAIATLRKVDSGTLRGLEWPESFDELKIKIQQSSS